MTIPDLKGLQEVDHVMLWEVNKAEILSRNQSPPTGSNSTTAANYQDLISLDKLYKVANSSEVEVAYQLNQICKILM